MSEVDAGPMPAKELGLLVLLMLVQFVGIMDFMVVPPLEGSVRQAFGVSVAWYVYAITGFTLASFVVGIAGAPLLDRFERKRMLLVLTAGFGVGAVVSGLSTSFAMFFVARLGQGAFAGIMAAAANAFMADAVPPARHGIAAGIVNLAYALAFIVGVPLGLYLAEHVTWHVPFFLVGGTSLAVVLAGVYYLPQLPVQRADGAAAPSAFAQMRAIVGEANPARAVALNAVILGSVFAVVPYLEPYLVNNLGFAPALVPRFYFVGGLFTFVASVVFGIAADKWGSHRVFVAVAVYSIAATLWVCALGRASLALAMTATTLFMIGATGRTVPAMATALAVIDPDKRGTFMSLTSATQQLACGLGALGSSLLVTEEAGGRLRDFFRIGIFSSALAVGCLYLSYRIDGTSKKASSGA